MSLVSGFLDTDVRNTHIKDLDIGTTVDSSAHIDTLLLAARQGDTTLADLCEVAIGEQFQVQIQTRVGNRLPVSVRIKWSTEANILADRSVLQSA